MPRNPDSPHINSQGIGATQTAARVVVATTVALAFITFWEASAVVLNDLASTMFYVGGITEQTIGKPAPWMILAVMLFGFVVRSVYLESCSMFVRGGVYVVVRDSMGPVMAKLSVSALVVDYILTGPISAVAAGQYLARLLNEAADYFGRGARVDPAAFSVAFSVLVTLYFWRSNVQGVPESSHKALRIMQVTTVMVGLLMLWSVWTLIARGGAAIPPLPLPSNLRLTRESLGWLHGTAWAQIPAVITAVAFGHSLLAMSGYETLAQVYRELAAPKLRNLRITANIVCTYALICTGVVAVLAVMIIPDAQRPQYYDNMLGGMVMHLAGPEALKLIFHTFVVVVGVLILAGAVNTSLIGVNGVMNRVAEDGVLIDWFRRPHRRFGTSYRILGSMALLQIVTIIASRGDVLLLGEAYAFGVVWSFALKALGVLVLRRQRKDQEYKVPGNFTIGGREVPLGLAAATAVLLVVALVNLFTKRIATISGIGFTTALYLLFLVSENINHRKAGGARTDLEKFVLDYRPQVSLESLRARPGCVLVAVRDHGRLGHLQRVLEKTSLRRHDIVVLTARPAAQGAAEHSLRDDQLFAAHEQELFSTVVAMAEKQGKTLELLVVPAVDPFTAMVGAATDLQASRLVTGVSERMEDVELARRIGLAWERLPAPRHAFSLEISRNGLEPLFVNLGPHPPRLWPEDVERVHRIWLRLSDETQLGSNLHHRDVVGVALRRLEEELELGASSKVLQEFETAAVTHRPERSRPA